MFVCYSLLNLFSIFITVAILIITLVKMYLSFFTLQNLFVLFIEWFHLFFLILPSNFLSLTLDVFNISSYLCIFSHLSKLFSFLLFWFILQWLIFIEPWNWINIDIELFKGWDTFTKNLFYSWNLKKEEWMSNHSQINIFKLEDIL